MGDHQQEYFYSHGNAGVAVRKFEYDATYDMFVNRGTALFNKYEVGSIFKIGGKEYKLNERDFDVCILFRLGFRSKEVSNMLDVTQGRISQISSKILQELFHGNSGGASELIEKLYCV